MLYTVAEVSDMLGFSKVTIYNKINSLKTVLKPCIKHKRGVMYLNDEGLLIIKKDLGLIKEERALNDHDDLKVGKSVNNKDLKQFKDINILIETLEKVIKTGQEDYINFLLE